MEILMSIKPYFAFRILSGQKKVEFRRRISEKFRPGTKIYIYASLPIQRIIGYCEIEQVKKLNISSLAKISEIENEDVNSFYQYFDKLEMGYAISLKNPVKYKIPLNMMNINSSFHPPVSYRFLKTLEQDYIKTHSLY
ncbi:MAG: ASCH domain-containing protein [Bdellovibrionales bacterium]|nr:ASCH domain-containing protein [Bdellovibrionales bacterium]